MNPYFSIVIPVKDGENVIKETINTVLKQSCDDWELIIVNDHSLDKTKEFVESFKDYRIKLFDLPEGKSGISCGRHFGNQKALGEVIVVADGDDWNYSDRLEKTRQYFELYPDVSVFYGNVDLYYEDTGVIERRWFQPFNEELIKHINFIPNPASAYKKSLYNDITGYDSRFAMSEDYDVWLQFVELGAKFGYIRDSLVKMRRGSHSIRLNRSEELRKYINLVRDKHNLKISEDLVKKIAKTEVYNFFTSDAKRKVWID